MSGRTVPKMARGIDHIVHAVRDLDAAADLYARIGFTVGARNAHPWGTHNRIIQFAGSFIELLTVAEPEKITAHEAGRFSFGAFNQNFLAQGEGLSMLALESEDAVADAQAFAAASIGDFEPFRFERSGRRPDGSEVKLAFSLAFAEAPEAARAGTFVSQQHYPENFWNPQFQTHPNGVHSVAGVVLMADNPMRYRAFLAAFSGVEEVATVNGGIGVRTPRGIIDIMEQAAAGHRFGVAWPDSRQGLRLAALRFGTADLAGTATRIAAAGVPATESATGLVVAPDVAHGAVLAFESRWGGTLRKSNILNR